MIATQVKQHRPDLVIESVPTWQGGAFKGRPDKALLRAARAEGLTLVTYDQKTIPTHLAELYAAGENHAGVIFVDDQTISSNDFGTMTRALILLWERYGSEDWQVRIRFVEKPGR